MLTDTLQDCIIIGGGPSGLTAGIYLKRFRRNIMLIDNYQSRAELIPTSHNYPGFADGISGKQLLINLRQQFQRYDGSIHNDTVIHIEKLEKNFAVITQQSRFVTKNIILATGVIDIEPILPNVEHCIKQGLIRHCPICDAYEVIDQKIAIIGNGTKIFNEALFLLKYSPDITLFTLGEEILLSPQELAILHKNNINIVAEKIIQAEIVNNIIISLITSSGNKYPFDTIYSALGAKINSNLALNLGAESKDQCLLFDQHQQTSVSGLFAIGDVTAGLNQICVATGHGAIAATAIHNNLL